MAGEVNDRFNAMMKRLHAKERYDWLTEFAHANPLKATFLAIVVTTSILPSLLFLSFMITSLCFGLMGLIFIEGTALVFAVISLVFVLAGCVTASLSFTAFLVGTAVAVHFGRTILKTICGYIDEYASKWGDKEGRIGDMIRSCRAITGNISSGTEIKEVFEELEKKN